MGVVFAPYFSNLPPKNQRFYLCFHKKARRNAPMSQPIGGIFKKPYALFQFCIWTGGSAGEITSHVDNRDAPTIWLKMVPKRAKWHFFVFFVWDTAGIGRRHTLSLWDDGPDVEVK